MGGFLQRGAIWIHTRYAHVNALRFDAVNPAMLGMKKVVCWILTPQ